MISSGTKKAVKALKRTRRDVWLVRAVALVISIILWMTVLGGERVEITKSFQFDYQLPEQLMIANAVPTELSFRVSGPQAFIKDFENRSITRSIDLTKAELGDYEVEISEEMLDLPLGLHLVSAPQDSIVLKLDRAAWKRIPIRAVFSKQLPEGFRVSSVTLKPSTVEVRGPESRLRSIDTLPTEVISLSGDSLIQEFEARIGLDEYPGIIVDEQSRAVHVSVELEGSLARSSISMIPVKLRLIETEGRRVINQSREGITVTPSKVDFVLEGPAEIIRTLRRRNIDVWAEISELTPGLQRVRLDWGLPPEVRVIKRSSDWVEVDIPREE